MEMHQQQGQQEPATKCAATGARATKGVPWLARAAPPHGRKDRLGPHVRASQLGLSSTPTWMHLRLLLSAIVAQKTVVNSMGAYPGTHARHRRYTAFIPLYPIGVAAEMVLLWCSMPALKVRGAAPCPHAPALHAYKLSSTRLGHCFQPGNSPVAAPWGQLPRCHAAWSMPFGPCRLVHAVRFMLFSSCRLSHCLVQQPTCVAFLTPGPGPVQPAPAQRTELWVQLRGVRAGAWGERGVGPVCTVHLSFEACLPSGSSMVRLLGAKRVTQLDTFTFVQPWSDSIWCHAKNANFTGATTPHRAMQVGLVLYLPIWWQLFSSMLRQRKKKLGGTRIGKQE